MPFVSLFFLNERNITTSLLMIHLKCTVVHYSNLNSSSINKLFLNYERLSIFFFFQFLIYVHFNEAFVKKNIEQLSFFNPNLGGGGGNFTPLPCPYSWFFLNNSKTIKAVTSEFCSIQ